MKRYAARRDSNESAVLAPVAALNGFWLPTGPFDGWLWDRRHWNLCEVKDPKKEGWQNEFTDEQKLLIVQLSTRGIPFNVLRTDEDTLRLLGARRTA
jgi:hypothetical protein